MLQLLHRLSLSWMILSSFILGISGSYFALVNIGMAYVTDITENAKRGLRYLVHKFYHVELPLSSFFRQYVVFS